MSDAAIIGGGLLQGDQCRYWSFRWACQCCGWCSYWGRDGWCYRTTTYRGNRDTGSPEGAPPTQGLVGGPTGYAGRNIHFGIREHAMAGIATGMALHGGVLPFAATFFTFSDYMRPSIRLAALSKAHVIYVWTHDSIGLPIADRKRNFAVVVDFSCDATFVMIG